MNNFFRKFNEYRRQNIKMFNLLFVIFGFILIILWAKYATEIRNNRIQNLVDNGRIVMGQIKGTKRTGTRNRTIERYYQFKVNDSIYENTISNFKENRFVKVGDSIKIIYLPENPSFNHFILDTIQRSLTDLEW